MKTHDTQKKFCHLALAVIETELQAIQGLLTKIDGNFAKACQTIMDCQGRIIVTGMGKSGHIGSKIAATLASTGTPAFFVHPGEASHGDMGMITKQDVIIALSNSGKTNEILTILPLIKRLGVPLIALTGDPQSILAKSATVNLDVSVKQEACPLGLAPTSSTTASLVMGDALAIALLEARGFTENDFALSHPGGTLGRRLLLHIDELMHVGDLIPIVHENASLSEALIEITQKKLGMTTIVNDQHELVGIFTDGDLRRALSKQIDIHKTVISEIMTRHCKTIKAGLLAEEALKIMETYKITSLVVLDDQNKPIGVVHMHALLQAGVV
ncbi:MAG: KpsF/GutQ family sugar-phosphate isomerase [Proteobacteria bacterium]|nr:KpsF/GutQ family sugar-phosphate isomerase [Pseudomonadota bacterium]